ncbi:DUF1122 family protein [Acidianus sp. RZ1]|uniref:DUF1122 family protein n=1 Tax=Acidianus sp. RZ1 TaxID=1540082 RepID=UPI0017B61CFF|nr:DUF1122 family protein [Acidianus sp. RZ1]NON62215.1 DUF1122 family protein [Acidianus sp. RZ1]
MNNFKIDEFELHATDIRQTHIKELKSFVLYLGNRSIGRCNYFSGRDYYPVWIELDYDPWPREAGLEVKLMKAFYDFLPPKGRFFITYEKDYETYRMLFSGYSVVETPLGKSLFLAGFRWFKNWYFPEGGNEGGPKIQTNKPSSDNIAEEEIKELLEEVKNPEIKDWIVNNVKRKS